MNYSKADFAAARDRDVIEPRRINAVHSFLEIFTDAQKSQGYSYSAYEKSWQEQRDRIDLAVRALDARNRADAEAALNWLAPTSAAIDLEETTLTRTHRLGLFDVHFNPDGSIGSLVGADGVERSGPDNPLGGYAYQSFGPEDFEGWAREYCRDMDVNGYWALSDFGKLGLEYVNPRPRNVTYRPFVQKVSRGSDAGFDVIRLDLGMPAEATDGFGAPRRVTLTYRFATAEPTIEVDLALEDKDAVRLPEASWFAFNPRVANPNLWLLDKLGSDVDPSRVVRGGNRNLHAVDRGVFYADASSRVGVTSLDAAVKTPPSAGSAGGGVFTCTPGK